jgi:hypothetical protein
LPSHKPNINLPQFGLITINDQPNPWNTALLTELNAKAEVIASTNFGD